MPKQVSATSKQTARELAQRRKEASLQFFNEASREKRPLSETVQKPPDEVYALLSNLQNFPRFVENLERVEAGEGGSTKWHFRQAAIHETELSVPMKLIFEKNGEGIIWKAADGAGFAYSVAVQVEPAQAGRGSVVRMKVSYDSAGGKFAGVVEKIFGENAEVLTKKNLQRFKAFCETGHVPTIEGQPSGREEDMDFSTKH